jgi:hypothetical protein
VLDLVEQPGNFLLMGLPDKELAGLKIRKCVDFALNPPTFLNHNS